MEESIRKKTQATLQWTLCHIASCPAWDRETFRESWNQINSMDVQSGCIEWIIANVIWYCRHSLRYLLKLDQMNILIIFDCIRTQKPKKRVKKIVLIYSVQRGKKQQLHFNRISLMDFQLNSVEFFIKSISMSPAQLD